MNETGISVIITAYNRKEFLANAINSVLRQNIDGVPLEIIVISNFHVDVPRFDTNCEIRTFLMDGSIGEFLFTGINMARYDIIAFLDDDDTFNPGKLKMVMEIFSSNNELCYYHNDVKYVDRAGREIDYVRLVEKRFWASNNRDLIFDIKSNVKAIKAALEYSGDFNLSSIAIRRNCYINYLPLLKLIKGNTDEFFFWTGIINMGQLMIDNKKFTSYRVHEMNVSGQLSFMSKFQDLQKQIHTFDLILNFLSASATPCENTEDVKKWITLLKHEYELMAAIFTNSPKVSIMIQMKGLLSIGVKYSNTLKYRVLLFSIIAMVNHDFAQNLYSRIVSKNRKT